MQRLLIFSSLLLLCLNAFAQSKEIQFIKMDANYLKVSDEALSKGVTEKQKALASHGPKYYLIGYFDNKAVAKSRKSILKREGYSTVCELEANTEIADSGSMAAGQDLTILYKMKDNIIRRALAFEPKKRWLIWT